MPEKIAHNPTIALTIGIENKCKRLFDIFYLTDYIEGL